MEIFCEGSKDMKSLEGGWKRRDEETNTVEKDFVEDLLNLESITERSQVRQARI